MEGCTEGWRVTWRGGALYRGMDDCVEGCTEGLRGGGLYVRWGVVYRNGGLYGGWWVELIREGYKYM